MYKYCQLHDWYLLCHWQLTLNVIDDSCVRVVQTQSISVSVSYDRCGGVPGSTARDHRGHVLLQPDTRILLLTQTGWHWLLHAGNQRSSTSACRSICRKKTEGILCTLQWTVLSYCWTKLWMVKVFQSAIHYNIDGK